MIGLKFWSKGRREITPETGTVSLKESDLLRQAFDILGFGDKRGKSAGGQVCPTCIFDPTAEFIISN